MITVNAIVCPRCGDTIYSRARHDFRTCNCGDVFIDGGLDYVRIGGKGSPIVKVFKLKIKATKKDLYDDWNLFGEKYGLIKGEKRTNKKLPEIEVCLEKMDTIEKGASLGKPKIKKCTCSMCQSVGKGIKEDKVIKVDSVDRMFNEFETERKIHPIYYFFRDLYYRVYRYLDDMPLRIKTFIQRGKKGWANSDTWGFNYYLAKVISEGVRNLKEHIHGMPCNLTEGQWVDILNKITNTFELAKRMSGGDLYLIRNKKQRNKWQKTLDGINKKYNTRDRCMTNKEIREYEEGWKLFKEYFFNLWD